VKKLIIILVLLLLASISIALPTGLSQKGNPALYKQLETKAKANLKKLPTTHKEAYAKLLRQHKDVLMAYLLAWESDANLAYANPEDVLSNYNAIADLLAKEGLRYEPEFFLSYIARQSVSDEAITAYRKALLEDGLQEVINATNNNLDRFRATTLWCVSRLQFQQTSGRDQSPLDITQKSLIGRCEEMQILLVAAARTVGLPSRPASTPWWAHMDNNHAWAEIFLDGAWHYTGDMDSAWFPDQTWFSGMIDKTVLILADGSLAAETDEILSTGKYDTVINSTRNYARERSRLMKLNIVDEQGKPVQAAKVIPMVFNWGSLRALCVLESDKEGKVQFTVGRGAFFISVFKDGQRTLRYVPSNQEEQVEINITLQDKEFADYTYLLDYPANPMQWDNQPEAYRNAVQIEKKLWQEKAKAFETEATKPGALADSLCYDVAKACRGNNPAFWSFVKKTETVNPDFLEFLLIGDPKFLWQASSQQFEALYENWLWFPEDNFEEEVMLSMYSPTVFYEELPRPVEYAKGKAQLYPKALRIDGTVSREDVISTLKKLKKKHKINADKALSGLISLDIALRQKYLSQVQFRILACGILHANGYPTEFSRIPGLISVFVDGDWQYLNVNKLIWEDQGIKQEAKTFLLSLQINDDKGIPVKVADEQLSLCRYVDGIFYPLNNRFEYMGSGNYKGVFPAAEAYLQCGYRISDKQTSFTFVPVYPAAGDSLFLNLTAANYPRTWGGADEDILALLDEDTLNKYQLILIGNADQENSRRIADKLKEQGKSFLWLGYAASTSVGENYAVHPAWQKMVNENAHNALRTITLRKIEGAWQMFDGLWDKMP